jgi:hypothetical protein
MTDPEVSACFTGWTGSGAAGFGASGSTAGWAAFCGGPAEGKDGRLHDHSKIAAPKGATTHSLFTKRTALNTR